MGLWKRYWEEQEDKLVEATEIAVDGGALNICEFHDVAYDVSGDPAAAYRIGNSRFTKDELRNDFSSRRELTDLIKEAIDQAPPCCGLCDKMLDD